MELLVVFAVLLTAAWICICMAPAYAAAKNKKERDAKLALMREYPHLAAEIWKSIDEQEAHHRAQMDAYQKSVNDAFR